MFEWSFTRLFSRAQNTETKAFTQSSSFQARSPRRVLWLALFLLGGISLGACKPPDEGFGRIGPIKKWGLDLKGAIHSQPVVDADGTIFVGTANGRFLSLSPSANIQWEAKLEGIVLSPSISPSGVVVVNTHQGFIEAFHREGRSLWKHKPRQLLFGCPPVYGKDEKGREVVFTAGDLVLVAYYTKTGKPYTLGKDLPLIFSCPVVGPDNTLYFGDRHNIYAWDLKTKAKRWTYFFGKRMSGPAFDRSGNLFFGTTDARVVSIDPQGKFRWHYLPPDIAKTWKPASRPTSRATTAAAGDMPRPLSKKELRDKLMERIKEMMKKRGKKGMRRGRRGHHHGHNHGQELSPYEKTPAFGPAKKKNYKKIFPMVWPVVRPDGDIIAVRYDRGVYLLTPQGLLRRFIRQSEGSYRGHPLVDKEGNFFLGSRAAYFYAFDRDGKLAYDFFTGGETSAGGAFSPDKKTIYVGTMGGHFYAIHAQKQK